jgi:hypothetical protein
MMKSGVLFARLWAAGKQQPLSFISLAMDRMRKVLRLRELKFRHGYFLFLLPLFFVFHGYNEYYGKIKVGEALLLVLQYELVLGAVVLLFFFIFRSLGKAALLSFVLGCFYFFFGSAHDWLKDTIPGTVLVKYSFILPSVLLTFIGLFFYLNKTGHSLHRPVKYLNILFFCLVGMEVAIVFSKELPHQDIVRRASIENPIKNALRPCDTCLKEDIHLIVLDEYAGATQLKEVFRFDNRPFADSLRARGFRVIDNTTSNYNFSPISIASMFSLDYLPGIGHWPDYELVDIGSSIINTNVFMDFLTRQDYEINNISIFDVQHIPAYKKEFVYGARLIYGHTFWNRLKSDLGYHLITTLKWQRSINENISNLEKEASKNIDRMQETLKKVAGNRTGRPQFYYTHLMMPHQPFVLDKNGHSVGMAYYLDPDRTRGFKRGYLEYLQYCNKKVQDFIDTLIKKSPRPPVIILMSDHGFRHSTVEEKYHFMTLNAIFFPDERYDGFYDGMSNVNQLRVLLNNRFYQQLPVLKDTSFFLGWPDM